MSAASTPDYCNLVEQHSLTRTTGSGRRDSGRNCSGAPAGRRAGNALAGFGGSELLAIDGDPRQTVIILLGIIAHHRLRAKRLACSAPWKSARAIMEHRSKMPKRRAPYMKGTRRNRDMKGTGRNKPRRREFNLHRPPP